MRQAMLRLCGAIGAILCATVPGAAQMNEAETLRIEFHCDNCPPKPEYTLVLSETRTRQSAASAELSTDGSFTLHHVAYGDYALTVVDAAGSIAHQEYVTISGLTVPMSVRVVAPTIERPPAGPVSVGQLQHPVARKAYQAAIAAQKFAAAGNYEKAADELEKAIQISPYFADAYTNLAVQHIRLKRYREAESELRRALEVGGENPLVLANLAATQAALKRYAEAAQSARMALRLDPDFAQAHYVLGMTLATNTGTVREGLAHLRVAARSIPNAQGEIEKVQRAMTESDH